MFRVLFLGLLLVFMVAAPACPKACTLSQRAQSPTSN